MRAIISIAIFLLSLSTAAAIVCAQAPVSTIALGPDQIGVVRTAQGITTRITFPEPVSEIICGDLYDTSSGRGIFVVQRGGTSDRPGNDVFVKPVASKGMSNMFVKTGDGKRTYAFDLSVVPIAQAHRVVNVTDAPPASAAPSGAQSSTGSQSLAARDPQTAPASGQEAQNGAQPPSTDQKAGEPDKSAEIERLRNDTLQKARQDADEIRRKAREQAERITTEAEAKLADADRQTALRAEQESERRFVNSLMLGLREMKVNNPRTSVKKIVIMLDPRVLMFGEKAYLRYTIQNVGDKAFGFSALSLETGTGKDAHPITAEVTQSKPDNKLDPGESLTGVIIFNPKQVEAKDKLTLFVRGEENAEIARVTIQ